MPMMNRLLEKFDSSELDTAHIDLIRMWANDRIGAMDSLHPKAAGIHKAWYRVKKESRNGVTEIQIDVRCVPSVHCSPDPELAGDAFNHIIKIGKDLKSRGVNWLRNVT